MAKFEEVIEWLKDGKKVYRPGKMVGPDGDLEDNYIILGEDGDLITVSQKEYDTILDLEDFNADDWEIYGS